jgi:hypothetical protein
MSNFLNEIADWQLEAKAEDSNRYFFHLNEATSILQGRKNYVIGRKGTGKTAISEHISKIGNGKDNIFTEKLSFKNFPFNELYGLNDSNYTLPNQYITLWKYLIYSFVCRMMLKNPNINSDVRDSLGLSYDLDPITRLPRIVKKWTDSNFEVLEIGKKEYANSQIIPWIEKVNILEDIIIEHLDSSYYYIIFDELDEDYRDIKNKAEAIPYNNLVTSLFKAVQDVRTVFKPLSKNVIPIIFLRDDIYSIIKDPDKNKWSDLKIDIDWDERKLQKLLAFRISRAIDSKIENSKIYNFEDAWSKMFENKPVTMGDRQRKEMTIFDFISRSTHLRPRDFVKYLQACASEAVENNRDIITPTIVKRVDKAFSNYLKSEIEDEIQAVLPEISTIFQIISQLGKQSFRFDEFKVLYSSYLKNSTVSEGNLNYVFQNLFDFGVIGNQPKNTKVLPVFRYKNREARFNPNEIIQVHRGLFKALQLY